MRERWWSSANSMILNKSIFLLYTYLLEGRWKVPLLLFPLPDNCSTNVCEYFHECLHYIIEEEQNNIYLFRIFSNCIRIIIEANNKQQTTTSTRRQIEKIEKWTNYWNYEIKWCGSVRLMHGGRVEWQGRSPNSCSTFLQISANDSSSFGWNYRQNTIISWT